ncbi:hypothetical protein F4679DRAFT_591727 [Xylaria curta]|nr:hypothetical protein F4679DRAFT_591727 [Xylaria curta]
MDYNFADGVSKCLKGFDDLITLYNDCEWSEWNKESLILWTIHNEHHRFKTWAESVGAQQTSSDSLQSRVKKFLGAEGRLARGFDSLYKSLQDACSSVQSIKTSGDRRKFSVLESTPSWADNLIGLEVWLVTSAVEHMLDILVAKRYSTLSDRPVAKSHLGDFAHYTCACDFIHPREHIFLDHIRHRCPFPKSGPLSGHPLYGRTDRPYVYICKCSYANTNLQSFRVHLRYCRCGLSTPKADAKAEKSPALEQVEAAPPVNNNTNPESSGSEAKGSRWYVPSWFK